jgi:hypothetical protein
MWWAWPHLRRFWAGVGTLIAGLTVTYIYNLWSSQAVPDLPRAIGFLHDYWTWAGGALLALGVASFVAERAHRRHEARAPQPLRVGERSWRERFRRPTPPAVSVATSASTMVGRAGELAELNDWFAQVKNGSRRVIFVSGEPGIGKTTLTRAFLDSAASDRKVRIGRGQCVEQYGAGEPYMPVLEALTRLCREPGGDKLVGILHRIAPAWLAQMPSLVTAEDRVRLQSLAQGTTQQRMLREMAEALEVIAADSPLVLFVEDLHWSDPSTLDLVATVARRNEPARLMILGTYRPVEMLAGENPLCTMKEELELHQQAIELRLPLLSEADVGSYLRQRFTAPGIPRTTQSPVKSGSVIDPRETLARGNDKWERPELKEAVDAEVSFPRASRHDASDSADSQHTDQAARGIPDSAKIASAVYARSEGNPLFMVNVVDYLVEHGSLLDADKIGAPRNIWADRAQPATLVAGRATSARSRQRGRCRVLRCGCRRRPRTTGRGNRFMLHSAGETRAVCRSPESLHLAGWYFINGLSLPARALSQCPL